MDRPRADPRARRAASRSTRVTEVGDVWLDAGIVPFSTLGWQNPEWVDGGYAHRRRARASRRADLPDHAYWEKWFPADWVSEMREQIRLWFYSQLFMSVVLVGRAPFKRCSATRRCSTSTGREMHGSWGNMIDGRGRVRAHGRRRDALAVLRAAARPQPAASASGRRTRSSASCSRSGTRSTFLVDYANIEGFEPTLADLETGPPAERAARPLARRAHARVRRRGDARRTRRRSPST